MPDEISGWLKLKYGKFAVVWLRMRDNFRYRIVVRTAVRAAYLSILVTVSVVVPRQLCTVDCALSTPVPVSLRLM